MLGDEATVELPAPVERDLSAIAEKDTLVLLTQSNSTTFFLHRGEPLGFEYEFLRYFAEDRGMYLKTIVVENRDSLLVKLNEGVGDVVAARLSPTVLDSMRVSLSDALYATRPVLVQRSEPTLAISTEEEVDSLLERQANAPIYEEAPGNDSFLERTGERIAAFITGETRRDAIAEHRESLEVKAKLIRDPDELAGLRVHVIDGSAFESRLLELSSNGEIYVVEVDSGTSEMLTEDVAFQRINYTVTHENLASLQEAYYDNLVVTPSLDEPYEVAFAVRQNAPELLEVLNAWISTEATLKAVLYQKYFVDRQAYVERARDEYLTSSTGRLSPYDSLFYENAQQIDWDWRLLAAQVYQESRFDPRARSWAGAGGLLQLMPATAREVGVRDPFDPADNVRGGVNYLNWLQDLWSNEIDDPGERLKFILASYNTGRGHVMDAQRLAEKHGDRPDVWEDVAYWLLRKSEASVYRDPVVRFGFCRGLEPVTYVSRILDRYSHYQEFVHDNPSAIALSVVESAD